MDMASSPGILPCLDHEPEAVEPEPEPQPEQAAAARTPQRSDPASIVALLLLPLGGDDFPDEALAIVCRFLRPRDLGRLACVSRRFTERTLTTKLDGESEGDERLSVIEEGARLQSVALAPGGDSTLARRGQVTWLRALWCLEYPCYHYDGVDYFVGDILRYKSWAGTIKPCRSGYPSELVSGPPLRGLILLGVDENGAGQLCLPRFHAPRQLFTVYSTNEEVEWGPIDTRCHMCYLEKDT